VPGGVTGIFSCCAAFLRGLSSFASFQFFRFFCQRGEHVLRAGSDTAVIDLNVDRAIRRANSAAKSVLPFLLAVPVRHTVATVTFAFS